VGLDLSTWAMGSRQPQGGTAGRGKQAARSKERLLAAIPNFNPFLDLNSYLSRLLKCKTLGIFTIGGGVPRNWGQQVGPYVEVINHRLGTDFVPPRFKYGVRICPEPDYWGGLSGCTYSEGISWGKFVAREKGGRYAEVLSDATLAWPILIKGLLEVIKRKKPPRKDFHREFDGRKRRPAQKQAR